MALGMLSLYAIFKYIILKSKKSWYRSRNCFTYKKKKIALLVQQKGGVVESEKWRVKSEEWIMPFDFSQGDK